MGGLLFGLFLLFLFFGVPLLFIMWTVRRVWRLTELSEQQGAEMEGMRNKILRLQNKINHLESASPHPLPASPPPAPVDRSEFLPPNPLPQTPPASSSPGVALPETLPEAIPASPAPPPQRVTHLSPGGFQADNDFQSPTKADLLEAGPGDEPELPTSPDPIPPENAEPDELLLGSGKPAHILRTLKEPPSPPPPPPAPSAEAFDLESLIGGDIMNKAGAVLLIIGLGLFLNYSLASMGPMVKVAMGATLSALLLAWGIIQDSRSGSRMFAGGLIGTGWAGLYLTAYAAHSLEATKVIESPVGGMVLMLVVAVGMVVHSLRFASEMATGLAFILAFIALFIGQVSLFTELGAVILGVSLLAISIRHSWDQLAVSGLVLTYLSMLLRFYLNAPPPSLPVWQRLYFIQGLLLTYWTTFEGIGMLFRQRRLQRNDRFLFAMNATAYILVSLAMWPDTALISWRLFAGMIAIQYLFSGGLRHLWCTLPDEETVKNNTFLQGSAEDGLALSTLGTAVWLWYVLPAPIVAIGWGILALVTLEIALRFPWQFLRFTGHLLATFTVGRIFIANFPATGATGGISHRVLSVVPSIALMLHLHLRTREEPDWSVSPTGGTQAFSPYYLYFATVLGAFLIRFEFGYAFTAPLWAISGLLLTVLGHRWNHAHLRRQGFLLSVGALGYGFSTDLQNLETTSILGTRWILGPVTIASLFFSLIQTPPAGQGLSSDDVPVLDHGRREIFALMGAFLLGFLLYLEVDGGLLTVAWSLMGVFLLGGGFALKDRFLRLTGLGTVLMCIGKVFLYDSRNLETPLRILAFIGLGLVLLGISFVYSRFREAFKEYFV